MKSFSIYFHQAIYISLVFIFLIDTVSLSQTNEAAKNISFIASVGGAWSGASKRPMPFLVSNGDPVVSLGITGSVGIEYGPVVNIYGMLVYSSIEYSYSDEGFGSHLFGNTLKGKIQRMPVLLWGKFISESELAPFLRIGFGEVKTDYQMKVERNARLNVRFHQWNVCLAVGGGFCYTVDGYLKLEAYLDECITFQDITLENSKDGELYGIFSPFSLGMIGLRAIYTL